MARSCSICTRSDSGTINDLLRGGRSARSIAAELGLSHRALLRHAANHLSRTTSSPPPLAGDLDPLDELTAALRLRALGGDTAQHAARHVAASARALADDPEWIALRARLLLLLDPFPEARLAIAEGLD
jgi:hypothetical protein